MNADVKKKWLEALRSGEYAQTVGKLHRIKVGKIDEEEGITAGYCCLGVLCDLAAKEGVTERKEVVYFGDGLVEFFGELYDENSGTLPEAVVRWADMPNANPDVDLTPFEDLRKRTADKVYSDGDKALQFSLAAINDNGGTFAEIADVIEEVL